MATKKCPVCGVPVKVENLERHVKNQHPREQLDSKTLLTQDEREEAEKAKGSARPAMTASGRRNIVIIAVVIAAIIIAAVLLTTLRSTGPQPGQNAPNFTLSTSTGSTITLSQYRGKPVLLEFMNTYCVNCQHEAPILATLYSNYSSRVAFLGVAIYLSSAEPLATPDQLNTWKTTYNNPWDFAIDTSNSVSSMYKVQGTPTTYLIDANGVVRNYFYGTYPYSDLASALNAVLG